MQEEGRQAIPRVVTLDKAEVTGVQISPTQDLRGAYGINVRYVLKDDTGSVVYQTETTFYSAASGLTPTLPAAFETTVTDFLLAVEGKVNALEAL